MNIFNILIYKNIQYILDKKNITIYHIAKINHIDNATIANKISRLKKGKGISTTSLMDIANLLEVPIEQLIK